MFKEYLPSNSVEILAKLRSILIEYGFYLAGGTALALQIGHRYSKDLDFFTQKSFKEEILANRSIKEGAKIRLVDEGAVHLEIQDISVSFFYYPYPLLFDTVDFDRIKVAHIKDIAAMKLLALTQRTEKKDYFDIAEVFKRISPKELKGITVEKYGKSRLNWYSIVKSLFFFSDVEDSPDPIYSDKTWGWEKIKEFLLTKKEEIETVFLHVEGLKGI